MTVFCGKDLLVWFGFAFERGYSGLHSLALVVVCTIYIGSTVRNGEM